MVNDLVDLTLKIAREKVACDYNIHGAESFLCDALALPKEPKLIADILLGNKSLVMNSDLVEMMKMYQMKIIQQIFQSACEKKLIIFKNDGLVLIYIT